MTIAHLGADAKPNCVYRYYDHAGRILYVGITARGSRRQDEHNATSEFFAHVRSQQVEQCDSRDEALRLERELIKAYRPPFNRVHNQGWEVLRTAYLGIVAAEEAYVATRDGKTPCTSSAIGCRYGAPGCPYLAYSDGPPSCGETTCFWCHAMAHEHNDAYMEGFGAGADCGERRLPERLHFSRTDCNDEVARAAVNLYAAADQWIAAHDAWAAGLGFRLGVRGLFYNVSQEYLDHIASPWPLPDASS